MANGIIQFVKDLINDNAISTKTTYSSDKIEQLISSLSGIGTEVILGCFATAPTTFIQDDQYYDTTDGKIYKAISATTWDGGNLPKEDVLYASIDNKKIYSYIKGIWDIYGGGNTKISKKSNNILLELTGQANKNDDGLYVPLSKKSGNVIEELAGQATDINNGLYVGKSAKTDNALQKLTGNTNTADDGLYVEDLNPRINRLDLTTKLNEGKTQEYFYLTGKGNNEYTDVTNQISVSNTNYDFLYLMRNEDLQTSIDDTTRYDLSKNGTTPATGSFVTLKAGITYNIEYSILSSSQGSYSITDENGKRIGNRGYIGVSSFGDSTVSAMAKYDKDTKIYFRYRANTTQNIYPGCSYIKIEAMEYLAIDPLQYIDNTNGTQDIPIGTIINMMGNNAPKHYLKCDGSEYQIKDYPYLAQHFKEQFGSANKFGGDGINTFRTPDLKGEFLRNTGINGHANQGNGAAVGTHQDATEVNKAINYQNLTIGIDVGSSGWNTNNCDSLVSYSGGRRYRDIGISHNPSSSAGVATVRPTNTSVLYCIKAEPTYFINVIGTTTETELLDTPVEVDLSTGNDLALVLNNDITLNDKITNYDKIQVKVGIIDTNSDILNRKTNIIDIDDISYTSVIGADNYIYDVVNPAPTGLHVANLFYSFKDDETITLIRSGYYCTGAKSWQKLKLLSVKGIKTTSVVQGGNFGGTGSSNMNCDCGILTTAQITKAVTDTETEWDK